MTWTKKRVRLWLGNTQRSPAVQMVRGPQFRSASVGKCPFVEDVASKKELERERERERAVAAQQQKDTQQAPRTRSIATTEAVKMDPPRRTSPRKALQEVHNAAAPSLVSNQIATANKPSFPSRKERQSSFPPCSTEILPRVSSDLLIYNSEETQLPLEFSSPI